MRQITIRLSEQCCPECGESFWQLQQFAAAAGDQIVERGLWFRCFNGHRWKVVADEVIWDAIENRGDIAPA